MKLFKKRKHRTVDDMRNRIQVSSKPASIETGTYYYVWGKTKLGRNYIDGPYNTEEEAWNGGFQALDGEFKVVALKTRDMATATRTIKRMDLNETKQVEESLKYARHQIVRG